MKSVKAQNIHFARILKYDQLWIQKFSNVPNIPMLENYERIINVDEYYH